MHAKLYERNSPADKVCGAARIFVLYALRLRYVAARLTIAGRRDRRVRGVHADTAGRARELTMRDRRRPVTRTRNNRRHTNTGRVLEAVARHQIRRGRVV